MTAEYHKGRIKEYMDRRDYASAIRECDLYFRCCESEPEEARAAIQAFYGYFFKQVDDHQRAIAELNKALEMPQCSQGTKYVAHLNLGGAHEALGHYDEAVRNYQQAMNHAGDEGERTAIRACLLMVCGRPGPSQGTEIVPGSKDLLRKLGIPGF